MMKKMMMTTKDKIQQDKKPASKVNPNFKVLGRPSYPSPGGGRPPVKKPANPNFKVLGRPSYPSPGGGRPRVKKPANQNFKVIGNPSYPSPGGGRPPYRGRENQQRFPDNKKKK